MDQPWRPGELSRALEAITTAIQNQNRLIENQSEQLQLLRSLLKRHRDFGVTTPHQLSPDATETQSNGDGDGGDDDIDKDKTRNTKQSKRVFYDWFFQV
jgi:hypothetical protein